MNTEDLDVHKELKEKILTAGYKSVHELVKVLESEIISEGADYDISDFRYLKDAKDEDILKMLKSFIAKEELSADKLRNAVLAKKQALDDAFYILNKIEIEKNNMDESLKAENDENKKFKSFAEGRSK